MIDNPLGGLCHCDATNAWDCQCIQDDNEPPVVCSCCDAVTDGSDYCDTCMFGDCPDCA